MLASEASESGDLSTDWKKQIPRHIWHFHWGVPLKYQQDIWHQKKRVPGLSCGIICTILHLAIWIQYRCVTDGQTDTWWWVIPMLV